MLNWAVEIIGAANTLLIRYLTPAHPEHDLMGLYVTVLSSLTALHTVLSIVEHVHYAQYSTVHKVQYSS